jgi:CBS-domain-containing membrane protein
MVTRDLRVIDLIAVDGVFLFTPALIGAIILVVLALLYNNLSNKRHYPKYWL